MGALVRNPDDIRLAVFGMTPGNGHPYSWSAIINGTYDEAAIIAGGYPQIVAYLNAQPRSALGLPGVRVTHVWCENPADAKRVAQAAAIPNIVDRPQAVIGAVDAVLIATDIGEQHLQQARPFLEAGVPLFIDKPLTDRADHLEQFIAWHKAGKPFLSTSCFRYATEFRAARADLAALGELRLITMTMAKTCERYGIHALEGVYLFLPPGGWESVVNTGTPEANIVHLRHRTGANAVVAVIEDLTGAFGHLALYGTRGVRHAAFQDTFTAFKTQLAAFVQYLRTGESPVPFEETVELMRLLIAGRRSREEGGGRIQL